MKVKKVYSSKRTKGYIIGDEKRYFLKIYNRSRRENEFFFSKFLNKKGIKTIDVLRYKSKTFLKFLKLDVGYTISNYEDIIPLDKLKNDANFSRLILESVCLSAKLHNLSIRHGDLSVSNFGFNGREIILINLETMSFTFSVYQAAKEFADYLHDIWKNRPDLDLTEILEVYISQINLSDRKREKFRKFALEKLKKWRIL
jgi:tRNA A-37 threonylcarbamoyl transferase component Bud32